MQGKKNIHIASWIIFVVIQNYLVFDYVLLPILFREYQQMALLFYPIVLVVGLLLIFLLPKNIAQMNWLLRLKRTRVLKYVIIIPKLILFFIACWGGYRFIILDFFYDMPWYPFALALLVVVVYVSTHPKNVIVNAAMYPFLFAMSLILFTIVMNHHISDYTYLLPIQMPNFSYYFLFLFFLLLDLISFILLSDYTQTPIKKKHFVIAYSLVICFVMIEHFSILVVSGTHYLAELELLGFVSLYLSDTVSYLGNLSYINVYLIPLICCFSAGMNLCFVKELTGWKSKIWKEGALVLGTSVALFVMGRNFDWVVKVFPILMMIVIIGLLLFYLIVVLQRGGLDERER